MVNIDDVYQKVLTLANKEQRGYITPQEFNLMADKAQKEIYNSYFHDYKTGFFKPKSETESFDDLEIAQQKLDFMRAQSVSSCKVITTTDERNLITFNMPADSYKVASVFLSSSHSEYDPTTAAGVIGEGYHTADQVVGTFNPMVEVKRVERNDLLNVLANPLTTPTINRPIYINRSSASAGNTYEIYPMATYTGPITHNGPISVPNVGADAVNWVEASDGQVVQTYTQANPIDGIGGEFNQDMINEFTGAVGTQENLGIRVVKGAGLLIDYWKTPSKPKWGYVVVKQKALYNTATTTHFSLHPMEEEPLVMKILELAGVIIENPQLTKMAMGMDAKTKQEQKD